MGVRKPLPKPRVVYVHPTYGRLTPPRAQLVVPFIPFFPGVVRFPPWWRGVLSPARTFGPPGGKFSSGVMFIRPLDGLPHKILCGKVRGNSPKRVINMVPPLLQTRGPKWEAPLGPSDASQRHYMLRGVTVLGFSC